MTEDILGGLGDKLDPESISPLVAYLAHEACDATGRVFSVGGGRVAEVFIAEAKGYFDRDLTPEDVRRQLGDRHRPRRLRRAGEPRRGDGAVPAVPRLTRR